MFKTCIIVPRAVQTPDIINHALDDASFHVDTIIYETDQVSFYVRYKWYQYYKVCAFKKAVKDCVDKFRYQSAADTLNRVLTSKKRVSSEQFAKSISAFAKAGIQGSTENSNK